jgi:hypothetical protein
MSSISALQVPGLATAPPAKPDPTADAQAQSGVATAKTTAVVAPTYPSPILALDPQSGRVILEYRDQSTGIETQQFPPKEAVRLYAQSTAAGDASVAGVKGAQA